MNEIVEYPQLEIFRDYIEDYKGNIDSYFYSKLSDLLVYKEYRDEPLVFNIFSDKEDSDMGKKFLDILKPDMYIEEDDCGIILKGLLDVKSKEVLNFFYKLLSDNLKLCLFNTNSASGYLTLKFIPEECKISFLKNIKLGKTNRNIENLYKSLSKKEKILVYNYLFKMRRISSYNIIFIYNKELFDKLNNKYSILNNDNLVRLVKNITGLDDKNAIKFMLVNKINSRTVKEDINRLNTDIEINFMDKCSVSDLEYISMQVNFKVKRNKILVSFKVMEIGKAFRKAYREKLLGYFNNHIYELIYCIFKYKKESFNIFSKLLLNANKLKVVEGMEEDSYDIILDK